MREQEELYQISEMLKNNLNRLKESGIGYIQMPLVSNDNNLNTNNKINLLEINNELIGCKKCNLCHKRQNIVFGSGNPNASLVFVGEGPGAEEDRLGEPFVGKAGELLTKMIIAMGLTREDVYISNIVKCRPPENRDPLE